MIDITRIKKDPAIRRLELLDAAFELFSFAGYEKTMIIDIVKKAGVAKGTFYYYFDSKEAVLEAICSRWVTEMAAGCSLYNDHANALEQLQYFIRQLVIPTQFDVLIETLWVENQFDLFFKIWKHQTAHVLNPILTNMIKQGNQEKIFNMIYQQETIAFFWSTMDCIWEGIYRQDIPEVFYRKVQIAKMILERIFGIEEGTVDLSFIKM